MSLDYTSLQTYVLADTHRADLTDFVAGFIRRAEGLIRRELVGYELSYALGESDRNSGALYDLPAGVGIIRAVYGTDSAGNDIPIVQVGPSELRTLDSAADPYWFCRWGDQIEFRGTPGTGAAFTLKYFGFPAALATTSSNDLLTANEELYVAGAEYYLYLYTQDIELADQALGRFEDAVQKLNSKHAREAGGAQVTGPLNFNWSPGGGY